MTEFEEALLERVEMLEMAVTHLLTLAVVSDLSPAFNAKPEDISDFHEARGHLTEYCNDICDGLMLDEYEDGFNPENN